MQSYTEAVGCLSAFLQAAGMPVAVSSIHREHVEAFVEDQLARHADTTAALRYRSVQQFFRWAVSEGEITASPMDNMKPPTISKKPIPVVSDADLKALLVACSGKTFEDLRDTAMLRLFIDTGCRLSEITSLQVDALKVDRQQARVVGKGSKDRDVQFGAKTAAALDRYLRTRKRHKHTASPRLWLAMRGPMTQSGVAQMLDKRCAQAGLAHMHPHQLRHTFAHEWLLAGGSEGDLMVLAGWSSRDMLARYGASAAEHRAKEAYHRIKPGERI